VITIICLPLLPLLAVRHAAIFFLNNYSRSCGLEKVSTMIFVGKWSPKPEIKESMWYPIPREAAVFYRK
jgi:hypothetical protein